MPQLSATLLFLVLPLPAFAQRARCGTPEPTRVSGERAVVPSDCGYLTNSPQPEYEPSCHYDIQVVFHVIQNNGGTGFLSAGTIQDQIDILNEDFQALPGTPGAPGTDSRIRFHLATTDSSGNPTTGITYSMNNNWFQDNGSYWNTLNWDTNRYMNIYTNAVPCCYGYVSGFPAQGIAGQADDRIVVWWEAVGRDATAGWPLNMGRTSTHEVGHYLGVYHTFCGGCGSASDCYGTGDLICDTNGQQSSTSGCPGSSNSCGNADPFHNYMDYTDDPCIWEFTAEQVNRMRCTLEHWRPNLYQVCEIGASYCQSLPNSSGKAALMSASGSASVSQNDLVLWAQPVPALHSGLFIYSPDAVELPLGNGNLCIGNQTFGFVPRLPSEASSAGGVITHALDNTTPPAPMALITPGSTWHFSCWFRDNPAGGALFNFAEGYTITFGP